ncbi:GH36-type glycosyl hydrolase domain-containing protein [Paenibacillus macerans]|uniref:GH36-type glycosyl hydrolase domain-containing protein n=1 Tax=Paenibacillus macerans TaxID=44252 RepID=UPI003D31F388
MTLQAGDLTFALWNSGDVFAMKDGDIMVNQLLSGPVEGSLNNLYMRLHRPEGIQAFPLLGVRSNSRLKAGAASAVWEGTAGGIDYRVRITLNRRGIWFWDVRLEGEPVCEIDVIYGQDVGLADPGAVRSNEAYLSQYIDHAVFRHERRGTVVCSRQNQPQRGKFPYMQQGALTGAAGYSTDGYQFFGLSYKETNRPEALERADLANEVYQYEFAYTALQTPRQSLSGAARFVFYGLVRDDHPAAVEALEFEAEVEEAWRETEAGDAAGATDLSVAAPASPSPVWGEPLRTVSMSEAEIEARFPRRHHEEREDGKLLSFFTETHEHIVLKEKELRVERPHGIILMSGGNDRVNGEVLTTTSYMYGVFNSQIVVGNTSFHKLISNMRNALNVSKAAGQRIYVELDGVYRLLTMPSMFEMGFNYARWTYKTADDTIVVTNYTAADAPELVLRVQSAAGRAYRYLATNQIVMNDNEYVLPYRMEQSGGTLTFRADGEALSASVYPDLAYRMHVAGADFHVFDERKLVEGAEPGGSSLVVLETGPSSDWSLTVQGLLQGGEPPIAARNENEEIGRYRAFLAGLMNGFRLSQQAGAAEELDKLNALAWWYTHNMLVHFSVPHGLEQYGGAAWGTRDVCQGPAEYFMATQKYGVVRDILKTVYAHQYERDGNWPQWFMFDRYTRIQQEESHGDVIVWPLKVLGDYLAATGDYGVLEEKVPYTLTGSFEFTDTAATIREHAKKEIDYIRGHFLHDTFLSSYGDGDWDDTLQPANAQLKRYMISSWTVALTYQTFRQLAEALPAAERVWADELTELAEGIKRDFNRYMLPTGVIPGFVYMEQPGEAELMLHPTDTKTGINYRLLPMTRSMIAELLDAEQAEAHFAVIKDKLYYQDGVRLMDRPAKYEGGVSTHFKRAEQAANFGREIGLQYVHAHIRFIEAMAKLGKADEAWKGLHMINPVGLKDVVPNAELRQSNAYFSSSDGKFATRYEADERFGELRSGTVPVKGGWRIYSSGPGIYMNQLISNCLGIRSHGEDLVIDPVLPPHLDGLQFDFAWMGVPATFVYHMDGQGRRVRINGRDVPVREKSGFYRSGGVRVGRQDFEAAGSNEHNVVEIFM